MKQAKAIATTWSILAATVLIAEPRVSNVTFKQDNTASRKVTITYRLEDESAIVTIDILTNGVSIGAANLTHFAGDVNRIVAPGSLRTALWYPDKAWPDHKTDSAKAVVTAWATNAPPNYMVVDLTDGVTTYYTSAECLPDGGLSNDIYRTDRMVFRKIPARGVTWRMGSPTNELGRAEDETPHLVTLTKDYWFGIYSVTMGQYKRIINSNESVAPNFCFFTNIASHVTRPLQGVGMKSIRGTGKLWPTDGHEVAAGSTIASLRAIAGNRPFDLPTETQWEYAARAGSGAALTTGKNITSVTTDHQLDTLGRYDKNCGSPDNASETASIRANDDSTGTSKVGLYTPNRWGIYDIHGNVADLCLDWYGAYSGDMESVQENPTGPAKASDSQCTARGGFWGYIHNNSASKCRLASRRAVAYDTNKVVSFRHIGCRFCLEIQ